MNFGPRVWKETVLPRFVVTAVIFCSCFQFHKINTCFLADTETTGAVCSMQKKKKKISNFIKNKTNQTQNQGSFQPGKCSALGINRMLATKRKFWCEMRRLGCLEGTLHLNPAQLLAPLGGFFYFHFSWVKLNCGRELGPSVTPGDRANPKMQPQSSRGT